MTEEFLLEKDVEKRAADWAKRNGWWTRKFTSPAHRSSPDRIFAKGGVVVFIEFKRLGQKPTPKQLHEHEIMRSFGLTVFVSDSVEHAKRVLLMFDLNLSGDAKNQLARGCSAKQAEELGRMKYQPFLIHMEPATLHKLAAWIRDRSDNDSPEEVELTALACEIEARLQHHARGIQTFKQVEENDSWDK